ncbi:MAG: M14 family zinc carboxypeptidase, partial [Planctomycetota bacterium]|nr:M14 family zinc carboxypeptidase [Planctomycetota bacterium]
MKSLKLTVLFLCLYVLTANASAQDIGRYLVPQEARDALIEMKASVHHGSAGGDFTVDLTPEEIEVLRRHGFEVRPFPAEEETYALGGLGSWTSYGQIRADFIAYAANYPDIAEYHVIGHSVQGREIFGLRISDNIQLEEDEPEVVFWGNIHGDEEASGEITYNYAMELLDNYGAQPTVTGFINDFEIWVLPLTNPDGRVMSTRENANGVDLNRDFGWNWDHWGGSTSPYSQVETQAFQEFCLENNVTLSATLHCSGNIFLYPWCYSPTDVPEDNLVQSVGALYANAANYTLIKSWDDYETHGELLDLMYGGHGALCYTPEISNSLNNFPNSYARNKAG